MEKYKNRIINANASQIVVIVYEIIMENLEKIDNLNNKKLMLKNVELINELMHNLDFNYEISKELMRLYIYVEKQMISLSYKVDLETRDNLLKIIKNLYDAQLELSKQDMSEPIMQNTQSVYAGFTYGKNNLNETILNNDNRGFKA